MFRSRDMLALVAVILLTRMAWNDSTESLQASANLAFYVARDQATAVSPMDLDGDGTNEALAVIKHSPSKSAWEWQLLDLKALHRKGSSTIGAPFQPNVLFSAVDQSHHENIVPIQVTTGQVLVKPPGNGNGKTTPKIDMSKVDTDVEITDRNRHYFCGTDWHHASEICSHPCPGGQVSECPEEQKCFADTPCDVHQHHKSKAQEDTQVMFELTPGGGLPSVVTLWSNGVLDLHSLTNDKKMIGGSKPQLELRSMWTKSLLPESVHPDDVSWVESNLLFLDAYDSLEATGAEHGMIVVSGLYVDQGEEVDDDDLPIESSFLVAVDAMKGTLLWTSFNDDLKDKPLPLPLARSTSSYARRRSRVAALTGMGPMTDVQENLPSCQATFRHHLKHVLPYAYWTGKDSHLAAVHLDPSKEHSRHSSHGSSSRHSSNNQHKSVVSTGKDAPKLPSHSGHAAAKAKKWHHRFHRPKHANELDYGRPNVLVTQTRGGMQIRSLRNGRPMCHLSLLEEILYTDLNNDGSLDQVQLLLHKQQQANTQDQWVQHLVARLDKDTPANKNTPDMARAARSMNGPGTNLCHALALSGLPAREELFSASLCGTAQERTSSTRPAIDLDAVAPVVVESLSGRRNTRDVIVALNNGMVHRLQGRSGRKEWSAVGKYHENFPTWEESGRGNALLTRLQSSNVPAPLRPLLLAGENSLAVLSVKNGNVLALAPFPQVSNYRPILAEVSGDGTTDVIVMSADGIWGFQIQVRPGSPIAMRLLVGLLLFLLMLAILRNRFGGQRKGVRASDL